MDGGDTFASTTTRIADDNSKKGETISRYTNDRHYIPNINVSYAETKMCDVKSDFPCTDLVIVDSIDIVNLVWVQEIYFSRWYLYLTHAERRRVLSAGH